jgi:hypothetical protein
MMGRSCTITALTFAGIVAKALKAFPQRWQLVEKAIRKETEALEDVDLAELASDSPLSGPGEQPAPLAAESVELVSSQNSLVSTDHAISQLAGVADEDGEDGEEPGRLTTSAALPANGAPSSAAPIPAVGGGAHAAVASAGPESALPLPHQVALVIAKNAVSTFAGNKYTHEGHVAEDRAQRILPQQAQFLACKTVYTSGVLCLTAHPFLRCSPDMYVIIKLNDHQDALALVEHKCSKHFRPSPSAFNMVSVEFASEEYYRRVPWKFRAQLLFQQAVTQINYTVLMCSSPTGPSSTVLIHYPESVLEQVVSMMTHLDVVGVLPALFEAMLDPVLRDSQVLEHVPADYPALFRIVMSKRLAGKRALELYRKSTNKPVPPTYALRHVIIDKYDLLKGGTDLVGKHLSDATRAGSSTMHFAVETKLTLRLFSYLALNTFKLMGAHQMMEELRTQHVGSGVLGAKLGAKLYQSNLVLGGGTMIVAHPVPAPPQLATPGHEHFEVWSLFPEGARVRLRLRARERSMQVSADVDLLPSSRFARATSSMSPRTPGHVVLVSPYWQDQLAGCRRAYEARVSMDSRGHRGPYTATVRAFWLNEGMMLRLNPLIMHEPCDFAKGSRGNCLVCLHKRKRVVKACSTCGEALCFPDCFNTFHSLRLGEVVADAGEDDEDGADAPGSTETGATSGSSVGGQTLSFTAGSAAGVMLNLHLASPTLANTESAHTAAPQVLGASGATSRAVPRVGVRRRLSREDDDDDDDEDDEDPPPWRTLGRARSKHKRRR